ASSGGDGAPRTRRRVRHTHGSAMDGAAEHPAARVLPGPVNGRFEPAGTWNKRRVTSGPKLRSREGLVPTVLVAIVAIGLGLAWWILQSGNSTRTPAGPGGKLAWPPPRLAHPKTVDVSTGARVLQLDPKRDYVVKMPSRPLVGGDGLAISGGHNVVLIGGSIVVPPQGLAATGEQRRGLFLKAQTGTIHVEGLRIGGRGLAEGIDLDERLGATVQLENIRVDGLKARDEVHFTDNHDDVIQTWAGPARLRVDHLTGHTDYQGFFLNPQQ